MELNKYIINQSARGKCYFTLDNASKVLNKSRNALRLSISHLVAKGEIVSVAKGFYVIIPPEYRVMQCIPPDQFIPYLMQYLCYQYYAGLLTASSYYGAAHQAPQVFQVFTTKQFRPLTCGRARVKFIKNKHVSQTPTTEISTPSSRIIVSTPEATAMDLVKFVKQSGGLNHVTTLLAELQENIDPQKLKSLIESQPELAWKQRLGYILEAVNAKKLANVIKKYLSQQPRIDYVLLNPRIKSNKKKKNAQWKIIENFKLESDI